MGKAAQAQATAKRIMTNFKDIVKDAELRRVSKSAFSTSTGDYGTKAYYGYTCLAVFNNGSLSNNDDSDQSEVRPSDEVLLICYTGTKKTYNSTWVLQSSASSTEKLIPQAGDKIIIGSTEYQVVLGNDYSAGASALFQAIVRRNKAT